MLGLGFPGGPAVEKAAKLGDPNRFTLPRPMKGRPGCNFSFSGLKTAVRQARDNLGDDVSLQDKQDLAASFQNAAVESLISRTTQALKIYKEDYPDGKNIVIAGGVAANLACELNWTKWQISMAILWLCRRPACAPTTAP